jgi:hypothetical protein
VNPEYPIITQNADGTLTRELPPRTPTAHNHVVADITDFPSLADVATSGDYADLSNLPSLFDGAYSSLSEIPSEFNPSSHPHGNITNSGTIGTTADLIIGTGTEGAIETRTVAQVRTLLGLATTDSPTFAGVTLGTSGTLVGGTNRIEQRNGTNAQISRIYKTFTSSTNFETLEFDASSDAANYRIGSRIGSVGGTTRGLQLGRYDAAGSWTSWLGIATTGSATVNGADQVLILNSSTNFALIRAVSAATPTRFMEFGWASTRFQVACQGNFGLEFETNNTRRFVIEGGGDCEALANFTFRPSSSRTLSTNGQFSIEMTSNTEGNLVYRGSDGTTRRFRFPIGVYSLPLTDGTNGQVLQTNGAGVVSFGSVQKTITSGTAAPSGGVDGDIYLQYT